MTPPAANPTAAGHARLGERLLGTDPLMRLRMRRTLSAAAAWAAALLAEGLNVAFGFSDPVQATWLAAALVAVPLGFVVLVRSGWSLRLADPGMTLAQSAAAVALLVLAYPVNGPTRGLNLLIVALVPLFASMSLSPGQVRALGGISLVGFGAMMAALALLDPQHFDPRVEALHFLVAALGLPGMAVMLGLVRAMRERLHADRAALQQVLARIESTSARDELTGLVNRRRMASLLDEEADRRSRGAPAFCVALIDLDHFKRINDTLGHARGDQALRRFAQVAKAALKPGCVLGRWGGEEFVLLMQGTPLPAAAAELARLRKRLADPNGWGDLRDAQVTFSAGLAEDGDERPQAILARADRAMHRAKAAGRDRTLVFDARPSAPGHAAAG